MQTKGIDISSHKSKPVTEELISQFDLILTMENQHKEGIIQAYTNYADRIFMISEMVGREEDVDDPIGGELEDYQETADILERFLSNGLKRIEQLANRR
jgi:protein-tyrosine-phosphatase